MEAKRLMARVSIAAIAGVAVVVALLGMPQAPSSDASAHKPTDPREPTQESSQHREPHQPAVNSHGATPVVAPSRWEKVQELVATGRAEDAFRAYGLLAECRWAREELGRARGLRRTELDEVTRLRLDSGELARASEAACGDLTDSHIGQRIAYLEKAASAGVPMAAVRLAAEGPWGDETALRTRPNDPLVLEWRLRVDELIRASARKGDLMALSSLSTQYGTGVGIIGEFDPVKALIYATAFHAVYEAKEGRPSLGKDREISRLAELVSPASGI